MGVIVSGILLFGITLVLGSIFYFLAFGEKIKKA